MMMFMSLFHLQEVAVEAVDVVASAPVEALTVQAIAALVIPVLIQILKRLVPSLEGRALFVTNMVLNLATAAAVVFGLDATAGAAVGVGLAGGLAGSKAIDIGKARTVVVSNRHKRPA